MIEYNQKENQLKITIPLSGIEELQSYQNAVLGVIRQFEIEDCDPELMGYKTHHESTCLQRSSLSCA